MKTLLFSLLFPLVGFASYMPNVVLSGSTFTAPGAVRIEAAHINCDGGSSVTSELNSNSWLTSVGNISSGNCVVTVKTGIFSAAPYCMATEITSSGDHQIVIHTISSTAFNIHGFDIGGAANLASFDAHVICIGAR